MGVEWDVKLLIHSLTHLLTVFCCRLNRIMRENYCCMPRTLRTWLKWNKR